MLQPKDIMNRVERKLFTSKMDRTIEEMSKLLQRFPEYDHISVHVYKDGFRWGNLSNDNYTVTRTNGSVIGHPEFDVTVNKTADELAKEAERLAG